MPQADPVSALADAFHEAALEPELWPVALRRFGDAFGGASALLAAATHDGAFRRFAAVRIDPAVLDAFGAEYGAIEGNRFHRRLMAMQPGEVLTRRAVVPDDEAWRADPMFRRFLRPERIWDGSTAVLAKDAEGFAAAGVYLRREIEGRELELFRACLPHLRRALRVAMRLGTLQASAEAALSALDGLALGVVLADAEARVLHSNAAARAILAEADGIAVGRKGRLETARPGDATELARLVAGTARATTAGHGTAPAAERPAEGGGALRLPRPSGRRPLSVMAAPLRRATSPAFGAAPAAASVVLFLSDPERRHETPAALIGRLHGLTAAESNLVVHLLAGRDLKAAAEVMGVSANTAKTLLQRAFERTGTSRQAELLALMLRGPAGLVSVTGA